MQIFGTRFHVNVGSYQLRIGISVEDRSDEGLCADPDAATFVATRPSERNGRAVERAS